MWSWIHTSEECLECCLQNIVKNSCWNTERCKDFCIWKLEKVGGDITSEQLRRLQNSVQKLKEFLLLSARMRVSLIISAKMPEQFFYPVLLKCLNSDIFNMYFGDCIRGLGLFYKFPVEVISMDKLKNNIYLAALWKI